MDVFFIEDDELYKTIRNIVKKERDCEPIYHEKFLKTKTKIRSYVEAIDFYGKFHSNYTWLAVM